MRILFTGGGTGGHVFPIVAVARVLKRMDPGAELAYIGPDGFSEQAFANDQIPVRTILAGKIPRYLTPRIILEILKMPFGFLQALWHVYWYMPDVIFSKGGYGSIPVIFWGWIFLIPIVLHESDAVAGVANRFVARFARKIFTSFPTASFGEKGVLVGNPSRKEVLSGDPKEASRIFQLQGGRPLLLILGGSQGAQQINDLVLNSLKDLLVAVEVLHQCGEKNFKDFEQQVKIELRDFSDFARFYHLIPFFDEESLRHAYAAADLIVSRAGSGSIFEIAALGKPSIIIPLLSSAGGHQRVNARFFLEKGGCFVLDEPNVSHHLFLNTLSKLFSDPAKLAAMGEKARQFSHVRAAGVIAKALLEIAG